MFSYQSCQASPACSRNPAVSEASGVNMQAQISWGAETASVMYAGKAHPGKTAGRGVTMDDAETMKLQEL